MKEYKCIKDYIIEGTPFALEGDKIVLMQDNVTIVNKTCYPHKTLRRPDIIQNMGYFIPIDTCTKNDMVNHPNHYTWLKDICGIEVIDITRHMDFCLGNAIKYILRAGRKAEKGLANTKKEIEDLKKAMWYIQDKINILENNG